MGLSMMLLSLHVPYRVMTDCQCIDQVDTLILPHVVCLSDEERDDLLHFLKNGGTIICTGAPGDKDEWGQEQSIKFIEQGSSFSTFYFTSELMGNNYYEEVNPYFWADEATIQGSGNAVLSRFSGLCEKTSVPRIDVDGAQECVILPFLLPGTPHRLVYRIVNFQGIGQEHAEPHPQFFTITQTRPVLQADLIPFLSSPEPLQPEGHEVLCTVRDHCIMSVTLEPVSIFSNEFDLPAAHALAHYLQERGIPVQFVSHPRESSSTLIILGGHRAQTTGEYVSTLLSHGQKRTIEQPGNGEIFIFPGDIHIIVIAGCDREHTALMADTYRRTILAMI
jgi:hypothetical protein